MLLLTHALGGGNGSAAAVGAGASFASAAFSVRMLSAVLFLLA